MFRRLFLQWSRWYKIEQYWKQVNQLQRFSILFINYVYQHLFSTHEKLFIQVLTNIHNTTWSFCLFHRFFFFIGIVYSHLNKGLKTTNHELFIKFEKKIKIYWDERTDCLRSCLLMHCVRLMFTSNVKSLDFATKFSFCKFKYSKECSGVLRWSF